MRCPYAADLCGAEASWTTQAVSEHQIEGLLVCVNGHRWSVTLWGDDERNET